MSQSLELREGALKHVILQVVVLALAIFSIINFYYMEESVQKTEFGDVTLTFVNFALGISLSFCFFLKYLFKYVPKFSWPASYAFAVVFLLYAVWALWGELIFSMVLFFSFCTSVFGLYSSYIYFRYRYTYGDEEVKFHQEEIEELYAKINDEGRNIFSKEAFSMFASRVDHCNNQNYTVEYRKASFRFLKKTKKTFQAAIDVIEER